MYYVDGRALNIENKLTDLFKPIFEVMAKRQYFKEAKAYRKLHPNIRWQDCVSKVSGKKVSGGTRKEKKDRRFRVLLKR